MEIYYYFTIPLLEWFHKNKRDLPFRKSKNAYHIWISEIMAQQTQIATLIPYYQRFIQSFPNIDALANADEDTVLKNWEGLGYYTRARNLHKAAKILQSDYHSQFPRDHKAILALPGIGPYTAGAIASIAFGLKVTAVDGNVLRVITRFNNWNQDITLQTTKQKVAQWSLEQMGDDPGAFNEALMELGALICIPKNPRCDTCPIAQNCLALRSNTVNDLPFKGKKITKKRADIEVAALSWDDRWYLIKRPKKGLLSNLWAFPSCEADPDKAPGESVQTLIQTHFPQSTLSGFLGSTTHVFTHIIWDIKLYAFTIPKESVNPSVFNPEQEAFADLATIVDAYPMPVAFSNLIPLLNH